LTRAERVYRAIRHREADRVPKGEWSLGPGLISALLGRPGPPGWEDEAAAREMLGMDLVAVPVDPDGPSLCRRWRRETDLFVFALVDGPFETMANSMGFLEFLAALAKQEEQIAARAAGAAERGLQKARACLQAGAHGVIVADDVAYNRGTFVNPSVLRRIFLPLWRDQVKRLFGVPVFFHADGNLAAILPELATAGFAGLHGLEPGAGMDLAAIKQKYGQRLCLWGNVDPGWLFGDQDRIAEGVSELLRVAAPGGGYIFATAAGCLGDEAAPEMVLALYRAAEEYGHYWKG